MRKTARFRQRYGIDLDTYELMRDEREGRCDICHRSAVLRVDHDHVTGVVRGLLCDNCNLILGHARDDVTVLASAITYLKEK